MKENRICLYSKKNNKIYFLGITLVLCLFLNINVSAKSLCDSVNYNNSQSKCESCSSCKWVIDNESAGSGHCQLKDSLKESSEGNCLDVFNYSVTVTSETIEGREATCTFKIFTNGMEITKITWEDKYSNKQGTLNENQDSFTCAGKGINFYNTNLTGAKMEQITNGVVIADFKSIWMNQYLKNLSRPNLSFAYSSNYFVYFTDLEDDNPYNIGGIIDAKDPEDLDQNKKNDEPLDNVCDVIPDEIINYLKEALKLIRWLGLVLMIVLGTLDFVKAAAADDQDAMKKASQNFIKRLIAVIILFLLPIIIELILSILSMIGFDFAKCENYHIINF